MQTTKKKHSEREEDDDDDDKNGTEYLVEKEYLFLIAVGCCSLLQLSTFIFFRSKHNSVKLTSMRMWI